MMEESAHIMEMLDTHMIVFSSCMGIHNGNMSYKLRRKGTSQHLGMVPVKRV